MSCPRARASSTINIARAPTGGPAACRRIAVCPRAYRTAVPATTRRPSCCPRRCAPSTAGAAPRTDHRACGVPRTMTSGSSSATSEGPEPARPIHFDGAKWSTMTFGPSDAQVGSITAIWGTGRSDVFAASDNAIVHFNGSSWGRNRGHGRLGRARRHGRDRRLGRRRHAVSRRDDRADRPLRRHALDAQAVPEHLDEHGRSTPGVHRRLGRQFDRRLGRGRGRHNLARDGSAGTRARRIDGAPVTQDLLGVWGSGDKDVWIVGRCGDAASFRRLGVVAP